MFYIEIYQRTTYKTFTCGSTRSLSLEKEFFFCMWFWWNDFLLSFLVLLNVIYQRCSVIQLDIYMFMAIFKRSEDFHRVKCVELFHKVQFLVFFGWSVEKHVMISFMIRWAKTDLRTAFTFNYNQLLMYAVVSDHCWFYYNWLILHCQ